MKQRYGQIPSILGRGSYSIMEYWEEKLAEFEEALELEMAMDEKNDTMIKLLREEIQNCKREINGGS